MADAVTINCSRLRQVAFSSVYYDAGASCVLVPLGLVRPQLLSDLRGKRVCATATSTSLQLLKREPRQPDTRSRSPSARTASWPCRRVASSAISTDDSFLLGFKAQDPNTKIVGPRLGPMSPMAWRSARSHPEFVSFVNGVLERVRRDGEWKAIHRRWIGRVAPTAGSTPPRSTAAEMTLDDADVQVRRLQREVTEGTPRPCSSSSSTRGASCFEEVDAHRRHSASAWATAWAAGASPTRGATQQLLEAHVARLRDLRGTRARGPRPRAAARARGRPLGGRVRAEGGATSGARARPPSCSRALGGRGDVAHARALLGGGGRHLGRARPAAGAPRNATLRACSELLDELGGGGGAQRARPRRAGAWRP